LGEYNALFAAGAFDFKTGLRLVQRRSALMGQARDGGMAAVIGLECDTVHSILEEHGLDTIDLANFNGPDQIVLAGPARVIAQVASVFTTAGARAYVPLRVSGAFHSRYMKPAQRQFADFLARVDFAPLKVPVIANRTGRPYEPDSIRDTLAAQLVEPVRWEQSIRFVLAQGVEDIEEVGPGKVLTGLVEEIRKSVSTASPKYTFEPPGTSVFRAPAGTPAKPTNGVVPLFQSTTLGSASFRQSYGVKFSYICGAMYRGIASTDLITRASRAGILSFFGAGGLEPAQVESAVRRIQDAVGDDAPFGVNLAHDLISPMAEERTIDVLLATGVRNVEASAFMKLTPALVRYRLSGLVKNPDGSISARNRILAKLSRPEVAESFLSPAPERLIKSLERDGRITNEQAQLAAGVPMADDVCVEGDSGGHTDRRDWTVLLPTVMRFRDRKMAEYDSAIHVRVGAAGGIATPETAAAAFLIGADFILTGSINLCTAESAMSPMVKTMLEQINVQDTDYAPAGDMFELGAQVQVLKRGVFFPARARKLHDLYRRYDSLDEIDAETRAQLETRYFYRSLDQIWKETKTYFASRDPDQIIKAESNPKHKMALVFRWYFGHSQRAAMNGEEKYRLDFQVHCGPSLGAFNQWVVGTSLEKWQNRHVDDIAERIMNGAAMHLQKRFTELAAPGASR
jgi:trans-AT polyketide synthase/acyltransferase/oxidoreductase domain-containing protein